MREAMVGVGDGFSQGGAMLCAPITSVSDHVFILSREDELKDKIPFCCDVVIVPKTELLSCLRKNYCYAHQILNVTPDTVIRPKKNCDSILSRYQDH